MKKRSEIRNKALWPQLSSQPNRLPGRPRLLAPRASPGGKAGGSSWRLCPDPATKRSAESSTRPPCWVTEARRGPPEPAQQSSLLARPLWGPFPGPALGGWGRRIRETRAESPAPGTQTSPPASRPSPYRDGTAQPDSRGPLRVLWVSR